MSVVVSIRDKDNGSVWVGCDSQVTLGGTKKTLVGGRRKIWKPTDDKNIVMGVVGAVRDMNILETAEKWVDELTALKDEVDYKFAVRTLVPKIFKELETYNRIENDKGMKYMDSHITFAYKDKSYVVYGDGCVMESEDILATGSGFTSCLGAWTHLKDKDMPIKDKLVEVIKAGCESDLYVYYPITIMNTMTDEVIVIEK